MMERCPLPPDRADLAHTDEPEAPTACPLPVDWLDFVESGAPESLGAHLESCSSCQRLVSALRGQAKDDDLREWLSAVNLQSATRWQPRPATSLSQGQLVLNAASYGGREVGYEQIPRMLFLVLDDGRELDGRRWLSVAPVDTDVENASSTHLLLAAPDSHVRTPLRVLFPLETLIADDQFDQIVGALTQAGSRVVRRALAGELDETHFGLPLEGPDDERLAIDRETEDTVRLLETPRPALAARRTLTSQAAGQRERTVSRECGERERRSLAVATSRPTLRSPVYWALLGLLTEHPSCGCELLTRFEREYGESLPLSGASDIYSALDALERRGLIEEFVRRGADRPAWRPQPRPRYRATARGVRRYHDWVTDRLHEDCWGDLWTPR